MGHGNEDVAVAGMMAMFAGLGFVLFIVAAIFIVFYVLFAIGLMKMAERMEIENPWLAWVPIANLYLLGKVVGDIELFGNVIPYTEWILVATVFVSFIPFVGQILAFVGFIYIYIVYYKLFKMYSDGKETLYIILTIFLHIAPIFVFLLRNNERVEVVTK